MKTFFRGIFTITIGIFSLTIFPQESWQSIGPYGGYIRCLAKDNQGRIISGNAYGGIFRTSDSGENWEQLFTGYRTEDVRSLAVNSNDYIFAGTDGHGLYRSTDDGSTWQRLNNLIYTSTVMAILISPSGDIFVGTFNGLYHSTDNGSTFSPSGNGINGTSIRALGFSSDNLFAGSDYNGVFRSSDNGNSWVAINNGIDYSTRLVNDIASTDFGHNDANKIVVAVSDKIYHSFDLGTSWENLPAPQKDFSDLLIKNNGDIVASAVSNVTTAGGGIVYSTDGGQAWQTYALPNIPFTSVIEDENGNLVGGSQGPGTFINTNGSDWNLQVNKMSSVALNGMSVTGGVITVATKHSGSFLSTDEGQDWQNVGSNLSYGWNYNFKINPVTNKAYLLHQDGTYKTNYGDWDHWTNTNIVANTIGFNSLGHTFLFSGSYCYRSIDDGNTFQSINIGNISYARQVAFDDEDNIYISTTNENGLFGSGIYYSTNNAETWTNITGNAQLNITSIKYADISGFGQQDCQRKIIAGSSDGKIFTLNNNFTWNEFSMNFTSNTNIKDIAFLNYTTGTKTTILTETGVKAIYESDCNPVEQDKPADVWAAFFGSELRFSQQARLGTIVEYLGTNGMGVFKRDVSTDVEENQPIIPKEYALDQNFPNPFNPITTIQFSIPERTFVKLEIFNTLGEKVITLVSEELNAGNYKSNWNASKMPSGAYLYKMQTNNFSSSKKMILIK